MPGACLPLRSRYCQRSLRNDGIWTGRRPQHVGGQGWASSDRSQSGQACAEPSSRPRAPRSGGGAERRALTTVSTRRSCGSDDAPITATSWGRHESRIGRFLAVANTTPQRGADRLRLHTTTGSDAAPGGGPARTPHHRFLLELHLGQIDALRAAVQKLEQQADEVLRPFREAAERLTTMPGISETVARVLVAEIGVDMTRFPGPGHLVSWAGLCPRLGRECREALHDPDPSRDAVAEDGAGPGRVGADPEERELSAGAVSTPQRPVRPEEGHRRSRCLHADRRLLHAPRREGLPRPRRPIPGRPRQAPRHPAPPPASAEPRSGSGSEGRMSRCPP